MFRYQHTDRQPFTLKSDRRIDIQGMIKRKMPLNPFAHDYQGMLYVEDRLPMRRSDVRKMMLRDAG